MERVLNLFGAHLKRVLRILYSLMRVCLMIVNLALAGPGDGACQYAGGGSIARTDLNLLRGLWQGWKQACMTGARVRLREPRQIIGRNCYCDERHAGGKTDPAREVRAGSSYRSWDSFHYALPHGAKEVALDLEGRVSRTR